MSFFDDSLADMLEAVMCEGEDFDALLDDLSNGAHAEHEIGGQAAGSEGRGGAPAEDGGISDGTAPESPPASLAALAAPEDLARAVDDLWDVNDPNQAAALLNLELRDRSTYFFCPSGGEPLKAGRIQQWGGALRMLCAFHKGCQLTLPSSPGDPTRHETHVAHMVKWIAAGSRCSLADHAAMSQRLRSRLGMRVRAARAP